MMALGGLFYFSLLMDPSTGINIWGSNILDF